jgi:hypothetical protein
MLVITPYGLRFLIGVPSLGQTWLPRGPIFFPPPTCFSKSYAMRLINTLRTTCKEAPEAAECEEASNELLSHLQFPKCEDWTDEKYQRARLEIANIIYKEDLGSEKLRNLALAIIAGSTSTSQPTPGTGTDIMDWLKRNWVLVAAGAVILLLLARRR